MLRLFRQSFAALVIAGLFAGSAVAGGEGWTEDFAAAKQTAKSEGKDLLLDFTGSDWCGWCIKLKDEVFSKDEFKAYAKDEFVLVMLDFPRKQQSADIKAQNAKLKDEYGIRGFPTIYLTDAQGRPYAKTGYKRGGPEAYVAHLKELKQVRVNRDEQFAAAEKAEGLAKAKHLHEALQAVGDEIALTHYMPTVKQIIQLDADNQGGLKKHYQDLQKAQKYEKSIQSIMMGARQDPNGAIEKIDQLLKEDGVPSQTRQMALAMKSQIQLFSLKDKDAAKATLQAAIEADPDSEMAENLRNAMKRMFPDQG